MSRTRDFSDQWVGQDIVELENQIKDLTEQGAEMELQNHQQGSEMSQVRSENVVFARRLKVAKVANDRMKADLKLEKTRIQSKQIELNDANTNLAVRSAVAIYCFNKILLFLFVRCYCRS